MFYYYIIFVLMVFFVIVVYIINLDQGHWPRRVLHIVNQVGGDVRSKIYLDTNVEMRFTLIVIRRGHHIIRSIFCEVGLIRGGIKIFT